MVGVFYLLACLLLFLSLWGGCFCHRIKEKEFSRKNNRSHELFLVSHSTKDAIQFSLCHHPVFREPIPL